MQGQCYSLVVVLIDKGGLMGVFHFSLGKGGASGKHPTVFGQGSIRGAVVGVFPLKNSGAKRVCVYHPLNDLELRCLTV
jgi:hypothetical protein